MLHFRRKRDRRDGDASPRNGGPWGLQKIVSRISGKKETLDASSATSMTNAQLGEEDLQRHPDSRDTLEENPGPEDPQSHLKGNGSDREETPVIFFARELAATGSDTKALDGIASPSPKPRVFASTAPNLDSPVDTATPLILQPKRDSLE